MSSPFDHPVVTTRYFFPRREPVAPRLEVQAADGSPLACLDARLAGADRTVLHFHGNGEVAGDHVGHVPRFHALGVGVVFAEYRGYGASGGTPVLAGMLADVECVLDALELPPERVVVFGRSIGSIYALEAVRRRPGLAGLILESGIADVLERIVLRADPRELGSSMEELRAEAARLFDHRAKISGYPGPSLILHAEGDHLVEIAHAERNHAWAREGRSKLVRFPRGDHNSILFANEEDYWREVGEFLAGL